MAHSEAVFTWSVNTFCLLSLAMPFKSVDWKRVLLGMPPC